ncbi:MAG: MG2 domain-containing protein, partial [Chthoniobacteraceae bacterium]
SEEIAKSLEIFLLPPKPEDKKDGDTANDDEQTTRTHGRDADDDSDNDSDSDDDTEEETTPPLQWKSPREVDEDVLKKATPVKFTIVPSDKENTTTHVFKIKVEQDGCLYLRVRKGVRALGDFALGSDYDTVTGVPAPSRDITIQGEGGVLALSGERKLSIKSRAVPVIEYRIARVPADQINHLVSQTEGSFQNPEFVNSHFDETNIARIATERQVINARSLFKPDYSTFDFSRYLAPATDGGSPMQGLFFLKARGWNPKSKKYFSSGAQDQRFILVTDIGILVKQNADGSRDVFLQSLKTREPLGNVTVDILARNGVPAVTGTTSPDGRVTFPSLGKPTREKEPVAIVARNGSDVAFIPFARDDRKLDFSRFDIDGVQSKSGADLDAFVFTERGVYRPGDEMHIGFTVKQRNWAGNLAGLPVETEVVDARGLSVQVKKLALPPSGFTEFSYQSAYESPTGDYTFNIYLLHNGKRDILLGSTSALVKEFLPDRMKIDSRLSTPPTIGWIDPKAVQATVTLRNLYGTPATARRIVSRIRLCPSGFQFPEYQDYKFYDRLLDNKSDVKSEEVELGEKATDDTGAAQFDLDLERFSDATYAMNFYAEGFEAEGGRSVNAQSSAMVSSLPYVVGYKTDGDLGYVKMNSVRAVDLIAIDKSLKKIALPDLEFSVILQTYVSVLKKQDDGTYSYESVKKETTVQTGLASIPAEGLKFPLPSKTPGNYFLELREKDSGARVSRFAFSVVGLGGVSRSLDKNAELDVKLNRKQYNAGDDIEVNITAPYTGSGLITIERDKVYAHTWFKADKTGSVQHIRLPEGFDGTGYVNVSFIRALDSKEIFMSPLSYAVAPFTANLEKRRLKIDLNAIKEAKPGEPLKIGFRADRPSKIVVYAVDQGILQVTDYQLPDPLEYYFRKTALMVQTSQIVDLLLPEFSILRSAAFGGDGEAKHLNPFKRVTEKPVVFWSGVIDADTTEHQIVYNVPDYFSGDLQIMAVAVSPDAVGSAQQDTLIRGPFVLTPG